MFRADETCRDLSPARPACNPCLPLGRGFALDEHERLFDPSRLH